VDPKKRRKEPAFYGFIPDSASGRGLIFGCMVVNSALLLLVRSVSTALLAMLGGWYVVAYYVSDMMLYFLYRAVRLDVWHWFLLDGVLSVADAVVERAVVKILVSFTGVTQFRGPGELGGCYWTFDLVRARERPPNASERQCERHPKRASSGGHVRRVLRSGGRPSEARERGGFVGSPPTTPSLARFR
jgi:hypothetical protein